MNLRRRSIANILRLITRIKLILKCGTALALITISISVADRVSIRVGLEGDRFGGALDQIRDQTRILESFWKDPFRISSDLDCSFLVVKLEFEVRKKLEFFKKFPNDFSASIKQFTSSSIRFFSLDSERSIAMNQ